VDSSGQVPVRLTMSTSHSLSERRLSRRQMLFGSAYVGAGFLAGLTALVGCAPAAAPTPTAAPAQAAKPTEAPKPAAAAKVDAALAAKRTTGKVPSTSTESFYIISWEGTGKIEKWQLGINSFFENFYPNMKLQFDWGVTDYWTKFSTLIGGGATVDMCWMHDTRSPTFSQNGMIKPLDEYLKTLPPQGWPESYYPTQVEEFRYKGKQYAFPYDWAPGAFYVNVDMLEAAGVQIPTENTTFDDLLKMAQKLTKNTGDPKTTQYGVILPTGSNTTFWFTRNFNGDLVSGDPPVSHFDDPNTVEAYQYLYDLLWTHKVMPNPEEMQALGGGSWQAFATGKVGLVYALNDASNSVANAVGKKFRITAAPTPKGKNPKRYQFVGGSAFAIPKTAHLPDIAYECMRWTLANPELLPKIGSMGAGGTFVSNMDFWEHGLPPESTGIPRDAFKKSFFDLGRTDGVPHVNFVGFLQWDPQVFTKNMSLLWSGAEKDVKKVVGQVHKETVEFLKTVPSS